MIYLDHRSDYHQFHQGSDGIQDPIPNIIEGSNGIQDLLPNFTMGSDWIIDPILNLVERSSGIIDPTLGSTDMSGLAGTLIQPRSAQHDVVSIM